MHLGWQVVTAMVRGARPKHDKKETPAPGVQTEILGGSCAARPTGAKAASDVLTEINSRKEKEHGGQSIGDSASTSVFPMYTQD